MSGTGGSEEPAGGRAKRRRAKALCTRSELANASVTPACVTCSHAHEKLWHRASVSVSVDVVACSDHGEQLVLGSPRLFLFGWL